MAKKLKPVIDKLGAALKELFVQKEEKGKLASKLASTRKELVMQKEEKAKLRRELMIVQKELIGRKKQMTKNDFARTELTFHKEEKIKSVLELATANKELIFQNKEKEKHKTENKELKILSISTKLASQYARSLIEATLDPLVTIDMNGKITDVNNAMVKATDKKREELIGTKFVTYFIEERKAYEAYKEVFAKGYILNYPLTIIDGVLTDVLLNGSVYKDNLGKVIGAVLVTRDVTGLKKIEKELIEAKLFAESTSSLAEEARNRAESATNLAENALKSKQQFLSNMSHEIRTPMNAIIGFTKVVLKTDLSEKQREYLGAIKLSGDTLIVLINDILDLAKVDAGKMKFEQIPFKMTLSISAMLHLFETKIQEKNLALVKIYDQSIPDVLIGDPLRLHQIFLNLLSNAVKFTHTGKITVSVHKLYEDEEKVNIEFKIMDTGTGIAEDKIETIFENFQQATSSTSRLFGGTGLGLAIVKQLIESQGGSIHVESEINKGSTFSFRMSFPKTTEKVETETEMLKLDGGLKNIKVLVVEDIALNQLLMKTLLDDFGFESEIAPNGQVAIEKLLANPYDIILMDLQMPIMNGFETTDYIRNKLNSKIPIIALTADVTTMDLAKCKAVGMNDYISKPVHERLLFAKIIGLIKGSSLNKKNKELKTDQPKRQKCVDLDYLMHRTKFDPKLMMEMISVYLKQTPPLVSAMKQSLQNKDWKSLYSSVHKMIPSFSIMGISKDFESMARKIQKDSRTLQNLEEIPALVMQLETICLQACKELETEFNRIKNTSDGK